MVERKDQEQPKTRLFGGIRWGLGLPTVILVGEYTLPPKDHLHILREFYSEEALLDDVILTAKEWKEELKIWKWFTREPEFMEELKKQRLRVQEIPDQTLLAIQLIRKRLGNQSQGLPGGVTVSRECPFTIQEFSKFRRPERDPRKPYRDKPLDVDNYAVGALHYLVLGISTEKSPRVRFL
jgi:hypothetical protein